MGSQVAKAASPLGDQGAYKPQALWGTKGLTSRKSRKPFRVPRGFQVVKAASPLGDQGAYKSQALWGPRGLQVDNE